MHGKPSTSGQIAGAIPFRLWIGSIPLFLAACLFAVGISFAHGYWLQPSWVLLAVVAALLLCCLAALRAPRTVWLPLALMWCLLGLWCAEMQPRPAPAPALASLSDGLLREVEGTVVSYGPLQEEIPQNLKDSDGESAAAQAQSTQRIALRVSSLEVVTDAIDQQEPLTGGTLLTVRWPAATNSAQPVPFRCGERIQALVRLTRPQIYHDPGVWNSEDYFLGLGVTATAAVDIERIHRLGQSGGTLFACRVSGLQHFASSRLLALPAAMQFLPASLRLQHNDAVMLGAMVTGDRTYLTRALRVGFERTGAFHMLVVSGLHLAIVAGFVFWLARLLRLPRVPATLVTIALSFAYALFTGFATPVQRSLWMVTLYLLGSLIYRAYNPLNTIGFATLCLLVQNPRSLYDSSLQMTLLAVTSIGGIAYPLLERTLHPYFQAARDLRIQALNAKLPPKIAQFRITLTMFASSLENVSNRYFAWRTFPAAVRMGIGFCEMVVVTVVAELAMTLPMALYFHRVTLFALPVNLLTLPLLSLLMQTALLTLVIAMLSPTLAAIPAVLISLPLRFGIWTVQRFGSLSLGDLRISEPPFWRSIAFCLLLAFAIVLARSSGWRRKLAWGALLAAAFLAVAPRPLQHPHKALLVEAIDVGQGDSLLLITPDGKTLLIDGGGFGGGPRHATQDYDIGEEVVSPALWARGIRHLDAVALTHAHADHIGGLPAILRNFHPSELWVGRNPSAASYKALLEEASSLRIPVRNLQAGESLSLGMAQIHVLAPLADYQPGSEPSNNDSLVLHVAYGATSVLLEGDAEAPIEQAMLHEPELQSTLLKVGHHGSLTSTRPEFLARVAPQWAIISCGLRNRFGHPRSEILKQLEAAHARTFSTDLNGAVCFQLDGKNAGLDASCGQFSAH
jgi:competence protein ComEC